MDNKSIWLELNNIETFLYKFKECRFKSADSNEMTPVIQLFDDTIGEHDMIMYDFLEEQVKLWCLNVKL